MSSKTHNQGTLLKTDLSSVAAGSDADHVVDFTSVDVDVQGAEEVLFQARATGGHASASGQVDFKIVVSPDGEQFDSAVFETISVTMSGAGQVGASKIVPLNGAKKVRLLQVTNNDGSYSAGDLNLAWGGNF